MPRRSLNWRVTYRIGVHTLLPDSFCAGAKTIPGIALLFAHKNGDFGAIYSVKGAKLRRADL